MVLRCSAIACLLVVPIIWARHLAHLALRFTLSDICDNNKVLPAGVGLGRDPQRWLADGDVLTSHIEGIGKMRHRFVAAAPRKGN
jgi:hypothetical protein